MTSDKRTVKRTSITNKTNITIYIQNSAYGILFLENVVALKRAGWFVEDYSSPGCCWVLSPYPVEPLFVIHKSVHIHEWVSVLFVVLVRLFS